MASISGSVVLRIFQNKTLEATDHTCFPRYVVAVSGDRLCQGVTVYITVKTN